MTVQSELTVVGRTLLADGYFDNEPDAVRAAIWVLAVADALEREERAAAPVPGNPASADTVPGNADAPRDAAGAAPHGA